MTKMAEENFPREIPRKFLGHFFQIENANKLNFFKQHR